MKKVRGGAVLVALSVVALLSSALSPVAGAAPQDPDVIPGTYIVVLNSGDPSAVAAEHSQAHNASVSHVYRHALRGYSARMSTQAAARIARDRRVAYVDQDRVVTTAHHQCGHVNPRGAGPCGSVSGTVTATDTNLAIEGATLLVNGQTANTDESGSYTISNVNTGTQTVTASATGYDTQSRTVTIVDDQTATLNFSLVLSEEPTDPEEPTEPPPDEDPEDPGVAFTVPTGVKRILWETSSATDLTKTYPAVAIIDTGISTSHPDLNVVGGRNCSTGPAHKFDDGNGHGTHVAGTVAANGATIVGVAPGAPLYAVRVLNNAGSGSWSSVICGVDWVTANADTIKVANMSLGGSGTAGVGCSSSSLRQAICNSVNAGVTYAVAAGNSASDAKNFVPAAYPEVITVAAIADFDGAPGGLGSPTCRTDVDDTHANFSNYGDAGVVDITAPGVCILSTWHSGDGYNTISGTSMSSPHVAGAAALYLSSNVGASPTTVRGALVNAGNANYSYTWSRLSTLGGDKPPLLDVSGF